MMTLQLRQAKENIPQLNNAEEVWENDSIPEVFSANHTKPVNGSTSLSVLSHLDGQNIGTYFVVYWPKSKACVFFLNWDSLHAKLNCHYEAWSYKKRSTKKITGYRKSVQKELTVKRCLLILDLKPHRTKESILQAENSTVQLCEGKNC